MQALSVSHFTKRYGKNLAVDNLSFTVAPGEFFGFLGPNGAGKTTTISAITGTVRFSEGAIMVFGTDVQNNYREARKKIGVSPQEFNVDIFATAEKILWYAGGYYGMNKTKRRDRIKTLFEILELTAHAHKRFKELSGGLKRRVMLARAMIHDPEILILDEPTAGVDVELCQQLWKYLQEINAQGKTVILTSHYLEEVELLCNRIGVIANGKLVGIDSKDAFVRHGSLEQEYLRLTQS